MTTKKQHEATNSDLMHEACDRTFMLMETFGEHVVDHPAVKNEAMLAELASKAFDALFALYQATGLRMSDLASAERNEIRNPE